MFAQALLTVILLLAGGAMGWKWVIRPIFFDVVEDESVEVLNRKISELQVKKKELELVREEIDVTADLREINRMLDEKYAQLEKLEKGND